MTDKAKETLDTLVKEITGDTTSGFIRQRIQTFNDGIDIPCRRWSFLNQFLTFIAGTHDARGIRQWNKIGRKVKKGAKALYIFVPMLYSAKSSKDEGEKNAKTENTVLGPAPHADKANAHGKEPSTVVLTGFKIMPVFRVEDTEGEPLDYEERMKAFDVESLPLIEVAKSLEVTVAAGLTGKAEGTFSPGRKKITMGTTDPTVFLHELSHAVDHALPDRKGDYAFGEVVAELSAVFLGSMYGVTINIPSTRDYIESWSGKGHVAFKVAEALERVEAIYRFIEKTARKKRRPAKPGKRAAVKCSRTKTGKETAHAGEGGLIRTTPVKNRTQTFNPRNRKWVKRDEETGRFRAVKKDGKPYSRIPVEDDQVIAHRTL